MKFLWVILFFTGCQEAFATIECTSRPTVDVVSLCLMDATCVVEFCADKQVGPDGNLYFDAMGGNVYRWFPEVK